MSACARACVCVCLRARTRTSDRYYYYSMHDKLSMLFSSNDAVKHIYSEFLRVIIITIIIKKMDALIIYALHYNTSEDVE